MPNPIQRTLKQARDAVPDQRRVRLPWQKPTLGERVAGGLNALADTAGDLGNRSDDARLTAGDRAADLTRRARGRWGDIQDRVRGQASDAQDRLQGQLSDVHDQASGQATAAGERTHTRLSDAREQTQSQASQLAESAQRTQSRLMDRLTRLGLTPASPASPASPSSPASIEDVSIAADRAASAAARAETASTRALAASDQIAALLSHLLSTQTREVVPAGTTSEGPTDIEIRVDEAAKNPLARAADAVAQVVASAGETIYDYSEGQYGLAPRDAKGLRREREKERAQARPVAIIEGHYAEEKQSRSRLPLLIAGLLVAAGLAGIAGFWFIQRRSQSSQAGAFAGRPVRAPFTPGPPVVTPAFDRVVRGDLLPTPSGASAASTAATSTQPATIGTAAQMPPLDIPISSPGPAGSTPTVVAGEPSGTEPAPDTRAQRPRP